jgi:hypothetical protein
MEACCFSIRNKKSIIIYSAHLKSPLIFVLFFYNPNMEFLIKKYYFACKNLSLFYLFLVYLLNPIHYQFYSQNEPIDNAILPNIQYKYYIQANKNQKVKVLYFYIQKKFSKVQIKYCSFYNIL